MTKEEILKQARVENKEKDVADLDAQRRGAYIAYFVGLFTIIVWDIVEGFIFHHINYGGNMALFAMAATAFLIKYVRLRKTHELVVGLVYNEELKLKNNLAEIRKQKKLSQADLAKLVGVSRNTISSIETGQYEPTAKLALLLAVALDLKFEDIFYF